MTSKTNPLCSSSLRDQARLIFDEAMSACSISRALNAKLRLTETNSPLIIAEAQSIDLSQIDRLHVIAAGKAGAAMLEAFLNWAPPALAATARGVLIAPAAPAKPLPGIAFYAGGHPLPNAASFEGARAALGLLRAAAEQPRTLCVFLISGGASAMMELPLDPAILLEDTIHFHRLLVHSGATIAEINCVRKHFSAVKGGRLAIAAGRSAMLTLLVSDVPPSHLDALGSSPSLPDTSTVQDCRDILARYDLLSQFPTSVRDYFASDLRETPKPGELDSTAITLLDSTDLAEAARLSAQRLGYDVITEDRCDDWNYAEAASFLLQRVREERRNHPRLCLISAGEVTVRVPVPGRALASGPDLPARKLRGGRNQHLALYMATLLQPTDRQLAILSAGSDGIDGNSDAAGAIIDVNTLSAPHASTQPARSHDAALHALHDFDSGTFLDSIGATIVTAPTGNNLRDLRILLAAPEAP